MSVQISYKKQFLLSILLIIIILIVIEGIFRTYDYYEPNCEFMKNEIFIDVEKDTQRFMCLNNDDLKWFDHPYLHLVPNQHYETMTQSFLFH